jgi:PleD family two-component response regulator
MAEICAELQDIGVSGDLARAPDLLEGAARSRVRSRPPGAGGRGSEEPGLRILIAEDDAVSRTILKRSVEKLGHEVLAAEDGLEAWELFQREPELDLIISD